ncbi:MAG: diguanylate cyclase [Planctomycetota bacterium]
MEAAFDLVEDVEVIAVHTVLELIGEVGSIDTGVPDRTVALLGEKSLGSDVLISSVIEALHVAEPAIRTVLIDQDADIIDARPFDAVITEDASPAAIRDAAFGIIDVSHDDDTDRGMPDPAAPAVEPEPEQKPEAANDITAPAVEAEPKPEPRQPEAAPPPVKRVHIEDVTDERAEPAPSAPHHEPQPEIASGHVTDRELLESLASNADPRPTLVQSIRARFPGRRVELRTSMKSDRRNPMDRDNEIAVPIYWGGRQIGELAIERDFDNREESAVLRVRLEAEADRVAPYLAISRRQRGLKRAAYRDPLTGAYNRRYFQRFLSTSIDQARERRIPLTLLVFDVDHFKQYNDTYGHAAGDEILVESVRALKSVIRPSDRVCRIGGDEFAVIFFEPEGPRRSGSQPPDDVQVLARRVQDQICQRRFPKLGEQAHGSLTISGGIATYPWDGRDWRELLDRADELAMKSKHQGKNAITIGPGAVPPGEGGQRPEITIRPAAQRIPKPTERRPDRDR